MEAETGIPAPMADVADRVAFITGATSGIGLGIARAFAEAGMRVAIGYRSDANLPDALDQLAAGDRVCAVRVDVTDRASLAAAADEVVRRFGKVHVLVNNAGVVPVHSIAESSFEEWDWLMSANLTGVFNGIRTFLPLIRQHGEGGQIIATSSIIGLFTSGMLGLYAASKFGVVGLMESLRTELIDTEVGVSVFCPGNVWAELGGSGRGRDAEATRRFHEFRQANPDLRMDPLEAGRLVLRGMRRNDLYILSHPEFARLIRERHEAIEASQERDQVPASARVDESLAMFDTALYRRELRHRAR